MSDESSASDPIKLLRSAGVHVVHSESTQVFEESADMKWIVVTVRHATEAEHQSPFLVHSVYRIEGSKVHYAGEFAEEDGYESDQSFRRTFRFHLGADHRFEVEEKEESKVWDPATSKALRVDEQRKIYHWDGSKFSPVFQ